MRGGGNWSTPGKPSTMDGRPLFCHMPASGIEPGPQRSQAKDIPLRYPGPELTLETICIKRQIQLSGKIRKNI